MTAQPAADAPLRTLLIAHHDAPLHHEGAARWLASFSELVGGVVIHEPPRVLRRRLAREWRRVGTLRLVDVLAMRVWYRLRYAAADRAWERDLLERLRQRYPPVPASVPVCHVESPNSAEAQRFIEERRPDLVLALCKSILAERIHTIPRLGTWVAHPGICPEYRNAHGCFWALANDDLDRVGLTLLRIDAGVDTGPVYGYFHTAFDEVHESHIRIQHRVLFDNLDAIADTFRAVHAGTARPIDTSGRASAVWGQPWLTRHLRWKRRARRRRAHAHGQPAVS